MAPDPATASLAAIKERAKAAAELNVDLIAQFIGPDTKSIAGWIAASAMDIAPLVAAVERLLELADEWDAKAAEIGAQIALEDCDGATAGFKMIGHMNHRDHAARVREAITRELTRKEAGE